MQRRAALILGAALVAAVACSSFEGAEPVEPPAEAGTDAPVIEAGADAGCPDTQSDPANCGECGHTCLGGTCAMGRCASTVLVTANHPKCIALDAEWAYWIETSPTFTQTSGTRVRWANKTTGEMDFYEVGSVDLRDCAAVEDNFYWAHIAAGQGIQLSTKRVMNPYPVVRGIGPIAIAVVGGPGGGYYWLDDNGTLGGCKSNCSRVDDVGDPPDVLADAPSGQAIATDGIFLYWTSDTGVVMSVDREADAGSPKTLAAGQKKPRGIAVDATHVYWANLEDGTIMKVARGGGTPTLLATVDRPRAIAIDATHVYWASTLAGTVGRVSKNGGAPLVLAVNQSVPLKLAVDDTHVYWVNDVAEADGGTSGAVMRTPK